MKDKKQVFWKLPLLICIELSLFLTVKYFTDHLIAVIFKDLGGAKIVIDERFIYGGIWRSIYFISFASGYYYLKFYLKERDKRESLEKQALLDELKARDAQIELNNARNAFLRAQINPHFLFNTLNFIYSKIHKTDPAAGKTLSVLARLMRYALRSGSELAAMNLGEELGQAKLLLDLYKISKEEEKTEFVFKIEKGVENVGFIPLVILTLMENMFKHGDLSQKSHPGTLEISKVGGNLKIKTSNLFSAELNELSNHNGLNNISQRLVLSYGTAAEMKYFINHGYFCVEITAPIS
ncbi:sensor histidine kinase [Pedobacter ginsenosidimutans]|uniref:sensor histidine kinase n=1 Tax=Pedobacter ginsenosidimutans TaxID=687842 RepID=UPI0014288F24|nr:histidine kinase [Pedobacter ginsenosidimutans]